jgi:hypothetical protein
MCVRASSTYVTLKTFASLTLSLYIKIGCSINLAAVVARALPAVVFDVLPLHGKGFSFTYVTPSSLDSSILQYPATAKTKWREYIAVPPKTSSARPS